MKLYVPAVENLRQTSAENPTTCPVEHSAKDTAGAQTTLVMWLGLEF